MRCLVLTLLLSVVAAYAQETVKIDAFEARKHQLDHYPRIHSKSSVDPLHDSVRLQVIVDEFGNVEDAKPTDGPEEFFDQAVKAEAKRKFKPFEQNGIPIRATFEYYVSILPPEQRSDNDVHSRKSKSGAR